MITTIGAIEFLAVMVLAEIDTDNSANKKKVLKWTYPELRERADLLEENFPCIRVDLRRTSLEAFKSIHNLDIRISAPDIQIHMDNRTRNIMELYRPSTNMYNQFKKTIIAL